jgi:hypothetical protein
VTLNLEFDPDASLNTCLGPISLGLHGKIPNASSADAINNPPHYTAGAIECLDAIESALGHDGFVAFLRGQVIKYNWRLGLKGPAAEDAGKAVFYANRLAKTLEEKQA